MPPAQHIVLLGDSIFDNAAYTSGKPDVVTHLKAVLPGGSSAELLAVDGATVAGIAAQLRRLPPQATHLVMSARSRKTLPPSRGCALSLFNDVILRAAIDNGVDVIELRAICTEPSDYANPIEPSGSGGLKIAKAIARVLGGQASSSRVFPG